MVESIIIDTDPGQDDAFAILLALASPELEVLGLTTVAGNVPVATTAANARRIVELAGRAEVPVFAGAEQPLLRPARHAAEVHGRTGLDGYDWPAARRPVAAAHAVDWMVETLAARPDGATTLVPLGPLTNIALLLRRAPGLARKVRRIVLMGGGFFEGGNMSPAAEFNILVDPEAAGIVFGAGIPLVAAPIDCTYGAPTPPGWDDALAALGTPVGDACAGMLRFFQRYGNEKYGTQTRPLHDALAVGYLLWPELFTGQLCNVEVETASPLTLGMTVVDWWHVTDRRRNCTWLRHCDAPRFYARMLEALARLRPG
ncbi:nucleoside hydrolase [Roseomonas sp. OT10]|uniref:nucleoside hydrolase n=1 Tax=Roseomonas cutis TaxID=2897332 RepID=UPI001E46CE20|nr:nucleoside hydrolase [Roseomonas sp. OT10]UFN51131.1 nucleoside hydrolase [Roseomonas sp. OT10]